MNETTDLVISLVLVGVLIASFAYGVKLDRRRGYLYFSCSALVLGAHLLLRSTWLPLAVLGSVLTLSALQLLAIFFKQGLAALKPRDPLASSRHTDFLSLREILSDSLQALDAVPAVFPEGSAAPMDSGGMLLFSYARLIDLDRVLECRSVSGSYERAALNLIRGQVSELIELHVEAASGLYKLESLRTFGVKNDERAGRFADDLAALRIKVVSLVPGVVFPPRSEPPRPYPTHYGRPFVPEAPAPSTAAPNKS